MTGGDGESAGPSLGVTAPDAAADDHRIIIAENPSAAAWQPQHRIASSGTFLSRADSASLGRRPRVGAARPARRLRQQRGGGPLGRMDTGITRPVSGPLRPARFAAAASDGKTGWLCKKKAVAMQKKVIGRSISDRPVRTE